MPALGQDIVVVAAILILIGLVLRRVPILGFFVRMALRLVLLVSPMMILVLVVGLVWFHGGSLFSGGAERAVASPVVVPVPVKRP